MSTLTKIADRISTASEEIFMLLKEEGLLKEAIIATIVFSILLFILI
jgi:hypothetical protein